MEYIDAGVTDKSYDFNPSSYFTNQTDASLGSHNFDEINSTQDCTTYLDLSGTKHEKQQLSLAFISVDEVLENSLDLEGSEHIDITHSLTCQIMPEQRVTESPIYYEEHDFPLNAKNNESYHQNCVQIQNFEFGAFGMKDGDRQIESCDDYSLLKLDRDDIHLTVANIHFPSNQPVAYQLEHLSPLLDTINEHISVGDSFVVIGDINCLTVVGKNATDEQKLEVIYSKRFDFRS